MTNQRIYNINIALDRLKKYCAIQDRCQQDITKKMQHWGLMQDSQDHILEILIQEGYVNELRYAKSFCRGKFKIKKWGRIKIIYELQKKDISEICIKQGLEEIDETTYHNELEKIYKKRKNNIIEANSFIRKKKIAKFLIDKGYESNLVWDKLSEIT